MWHRIPTRHKAFAGFSAIFAADKTFDVAREHVFLATHETLMHAKLFYASLPVAAVVIGVAVLVAIRAGGSRDVN